jgi:hypothetical protein
MKQTALFYLDLLFEFRCFVYLHEIVRKSLCTVIPVFLAPPVGVRSTLVNRKCLSNYIAKYNRLRNVFIFLGELDVFYTKEYELYLSQKSKTFFDLLWVVQKSGFLLENSRINTSKYESRKSSLSLQRSLRSLDLKSIEDLSILFQSFFDDSKFVVERPIRSLRTSLCWSWAVGHGLSDGCFPLAASKWISVMACLPDGEYVSHELANHVVAHKKTDLQAELAADIVVFSLFQVLCHCRWKQDMSKSSIDWLKQLHERLMVLDPIRAQVFEVSLLT